VMDRQEIIENSLVIIGFFLAFFAAAALGM
jgi:hypothetical protein